MSKVKYTDCLRKKRGWNRIIALGFYMCFICPNPYFLFIVLKMLPLVSYFGSYPLKLLPRLLSLSKLLILALRCHWSMPA